MQIATTSPPFEFKGIGALLKAGRLKVPPNQREFSWEDKQVNDLFQDFQNAITKNQSNYFLGTIVVSKGTRDVPEVVDGQQRLATTTILLAAIRDYCFYNRKTWQDSIDTDFLMTYDRTEDERVPKLALNTDDNEYFKNRVISLPDSSERKNTQAKKQSHRRINEACQKAENLIANLVKDQSERNIKDVLNCWLKFVEEKAKIILLTVPDESDAYMMFETLNDRGLKTSQADLVKNYLFSKADFRLTEAQQKWSKMVATLETLDLEDIVMTYLRHLVIALFGPTREKEIFEKIKNEVQGRPQAVMFLDKIAYYADAYAAILTPTHPKWSNYPSRISTSIDVIKELKVQQIRPLMLAVAQHFEPTEADIAFRSFVSWTVRFLVVGGMRGGQLEDAYGDRAFEVATSKVKTAKELFENLRSVIPSDGEFRSAFATARVSQHNLARYYLRAIENHLREQAQPELVPSKDTERLNLEHIIPQELGEDWKHIDSETADAYTKRIGNLTLLKPKPNSDLGNASFQVKRAEYKNSQLFITQGICDDTTDQTQWGPTNINERQRKLADLAVETWSLSPK
jgi:vacuolar-type H+-ATPase subunit H